MTRTALIATIEGHARYVQTVEAPVLEETNSAGDNIYRMNICLLKQGSTSVVQYNNIYFTVIDEGGPGEDAYILLRGESDLF